MAFVLRGYYAVLNGIRLATVDAVAVTGAAAAAVIAAIDHACDSVAAARRVAEAFATGAPPART